eukprot:1352475-Amorphochlora_amoeboformis.AAC.1
MEGGGALPTCLIDLGYSQRSSDVHRRVIPGGTRRIPGYQIPFEFGFVLRSGSLHLIENHGKVSQHLHQGRKHAREYHPQKGGDLKQDPFRSPCPERRGILLHTHGTGGFWHGFGVNHNTTGTYIARV